MTYCDVFEIYEMMVEDCIARNPEFFDKLDHINELVDVREIVNKEDINEEYN